MVTSSIRSIFNDSGPFRFPSAAVFASAFAPPGLSRKQRASVRSCVSAGQAESARHGRCFKRFNLLGKSLGDNISINKMDPHFLMNIAEDEADVFAALAAMDEDSRIWYNSPCKVDIVSILVFNCIFLFIDRHCALRARF